MNIEEDIKNLKTYIELVIEKNYCDCNELNTICYGKYGDGSKNVAKSIENVLTAYENLKSYNRGTKEALKVAEDLEGKANKEAGDWEARCFELEAELEKEKETSHYNQSQLDIANAKLVEEKEKTEYEKELRIKYQRRYDSVKEKNSNAKWYIHQEIVRIKEDIEDYIDDDKEGNKHIIGEFKEDVKQWQDVEKLLNGKSKDELYMDWRKYGEYE